LDFKTDAKLRYALKNYTKDAALIVIAQRVSTILDADNIVVLEDGRCVGQGKHAELLKTCKTYREIVESQLDKEEIEKTLTMYQNIAKEGE
jgi:ATP-binding cassette subfamily B protein